MCTTQWYSNIIPDGRPSTDLDEKWARKDSNLQPSGYEPPAPPLSYRPQQTTFYSSAPCPFGYLRPIELQAPDRWHYIITRLQ